MGISLLVLSTWQYLIRSLAKTSLMDQSLQETYRYVCHKIPGTNAIKTQTFN